MTDTMDKPGKLDLYVEKIVSYMNLDDAQRDDVVREIRSHLEEAIEEGTRRGMTRERAETVAMDRFGDPAMLAGQFGTLQGKMWVVFEALAFALVVFYTLRFAVQNISDYPAVISDTHLAIIAGLISAAILAWRLWNRVRVNGTLRVYRILRPTLAIPFESIKAIETSRFHLFGPRQVYVTFENDKKVKISSGWQNFRCVGLALEVLAPDAIDPRAAEFFRRLRQNVGTESLTKKLLLTTGWVGLAALLAYTFPLLWNSHGLSLAHVLVLVGAFGLLTFQYKGQLDRGKRTLALLFLIGWLLFIWPSTIYSMFSTVGLRPLGVLLATLLPLPMLILWWHGTRRTILFAVAGVWIAGSVFASRSVEEEFPGRSIGVVDGMVGPAAWLNDSRDGHKRTYVMLGLDSKKDEKDPRSSEPLLNFISDGTVTQQKLDTGNWNIISGGVGPDSFLLARDFVKPSTYSEVEVSEIYELSPSGKLEEVAITSSTSSFASSLLRPNLVISPDGRYYLTTYIEESESSGSAGSTHCLGVVDLQTGSLMPFKDFKLQNAIRWTTSSTLHLLYDGPLSSGPMAAGSYELWELDVARGEAKNTDVKFEFGVPVNIAYFSSDKYAVVKGLDKLHFLDLDTGTSVSLLAPSEEVGAIHWSPNLNKAVYVHDDDAGDRWILVAGPDGIENEFKYGPPHDIASMSLSPAGDKLFFAVRPDISHTLPLGQLWVWDIKRKIIGKCGNIPFIGTTLGFIADDSGTRYPRVQWTPDGKSVIWSYHEPIYDNDIHVGARIVSIDEEQL